MISSKTIRDVMSRREQSFVKLFFAALYTTLNKSLILTDIKGI